MPKKEQDLLAAKKAKKDEFYTRLEDIEFEMRNYRDYFKGKVIFCNCDDPYESNFFKYFAMNFKYLGIKKLIATCYATSPIVYTQLSLFNDGEIAAADDNGKKPYKHLKYARKRLHNHRKYKCFNIQRSI